MQLVSKISNLCDHKSPTLQTDGQTDGRHAIARPRKCTKVHCAVKTNFQPGGTSRTTPKKHNKNTLKIAEDKQAVNEYSSKIYQISQINIDLKNWG